MAKRKTDTGDGQVPGKVWRKGLTKAAGPAVKTLFVERGWGLVMDDGKFSGLFLNGRTILLGKGKVDLAKLKESMSFVRETLQKQVRERFPEGNHFHVADKTIQWALAACHKPLAAINREKPLHIYGDVTKGRHDIPFLLAAHALAPGLTEGVLGARIDWYDDEARALVKQRQETFLAGLGDAVLAKDIWRHLDRTVKVPKAAMKRMLRVYRKHPEELVRMLVEDKDPASFLGIPVPDAVDAPSRGYWFDDNGAIMTHYVKFRKGIMNKVRGTKPEKQVMDAVDRFCKRVYGFNTGVAEIVCKAVTDPALWENPAVISGIMKRMDRFAAKDRKETDIERYNGRKRRPGSESAARNILFGPSRVRKNDIPETARTTLLSSALLDMPTTTGNILFLSGGKPSPKKAMRHLGLHKSLAAIPAKYGTWHEYSIWKVINWSRENPWAASLVNGLSWTEERACACAAFLDGDRFRTAFRASAGARATQRWAIRVFGSGQAGDGYQDLKRSREDMEQAIDFILACFPEGDDEALSYGCRAAAARPFRENMALGTVLRLSSKWHGDREILARLDQEERIRIAMEREEAENEELRRRRVRERAARAERDRAEAENRAVPFPLLDWMPRGEMAGLSCRRLSSGKELRAEGDRMLHCVGNTGYMKEGIEGVTAFYSVSMPGNDRGTGKATLSVCLRDGEVSIVQLKAVRNHEPDQAILEGCRKWVNDWNRMMREQRAA